MSELGKIGVMKRDGKFTEGLYNSVQPLEPIDTLDEVARRAQKVIAKDWTVYLITIRYTK